MVCIVSSGRRNHPVGRWGYRSSNILTFQKFCRSCHFVPPSFWRDEATRRNGFDRINPARRRKRDSKGACPFGAVRAGPGFRGRAPVPAAQGNQTSIFNVRGYKKDCHVTGSLFFVLPSGSLPARASIRAQKGANAPAAAGSGLQMPPL